MSKDEEVLPDSQDEAELNTSDLLGHEWSPLRGRDPLTNASIPSLGTSPSFAIPRPKPANGTPTSKISQYTGDTVLNTVPDGTSFISAFTTSSSRRPSSKPRPKPKPNFVGAIETDDPAIQGYVGKISTIELPSVTGKTQPPPLPESMFTADISERIKARRALAKQKDQTIENKQSSLRDEVEGGQDSSSLISRKRKRDLTQDNKLSYAHPPKNRPLSAILQIVNGSSPRPRPSPSISRNLLTRIVPLHPNRRTPPPPPPPRIIPKKTKKELEREEKWEEELQETVEGWCELEEAERERLRRAKRDWELGLYEE